MDIRMQITVAPSPGRGCSQQTRHYGEVERRVKTSPKWSRDEAGEEASPGESGLLRRREMGQDLCADQMLNRGVAPECGEERRDGREGGDTGCCLLRYPGRQIRRG